MINRLCFLVLLSLAAPLAVAHPHAWMDLQTRFLINEQQQLTGLDLIWHFDDFYSANIIEDMKLKEEPLEKQFQDFARQSIEFMAVDNWLTHLELNGKKLTFSNPTIIPIRMLKYPTVTPTDSRAGTGLGLDVCMPRADARSPAAIASTSGATAPWATTRPCGRPWPPPWCS